MGESSSVTTQLFFPDAVTDEVLGKPEYAARRERDTTNATDSIFANQGDKKRVAVGTNAAWPSMSRRGDRTSGSSVALIRAPERGPPQRAVLP